MIQEKKVEVGKGVPQFGMACPKPEPRIAFCVKCTQYNIVQFNKALT